jgi:hypothetical protein
MNCLFFNNTSGCKFFDILIILEYGGAISINGFIHKPNFRYSLII